MFLLIKALLAGPEVLESLENAQRDLRGLKTDVEDLYDRLQRLQGRLSKRGELTRLPEQPNGDAEKPEDQRIAQLNAEILARRRPRAL